MRSILGGPSSLTPEAVPYDAAYSGRERSSLALVGTPRRLAAPRGAGLTAALEQEGEAIGHGLTGTIPRCPIGARSSQGQLTVGDRNGCSERQVQNLFPSAADHRDTHDQPSSMDALDVDGATAVLNDAIGTHARAIGIGRLAQANGPFDRLGQSDVGEAA